jgi:hypothetical protein
VSEARRAGPERPTRDIDPTGKHALFSAPPMAAPDQLGPGQGKEGRQALFSTGARQFGTVVVTCSACRSRARISLGDLAVRLATISAWVPGRRYSHWMRCPGCGGHQWCAIDWQA